MTNGNFMKHLFILRTIKSKPLSANIGTIYMETLKQKHSPPEESGIEVVKGGGHNTAHTHTCTHTRMTPNHIIRKRRGEIFIT